MFDLKTLLLVLIISHGLSTAIIYLNWRTSPDVPGVQQWVAGRILVTIGLGVLLSRVGVPLAVSVLVGNGLLFWGFYTVWLGSRRFLGAPPFNPLPYYCGIALFLAAFAFFTLVEDSFQTRTVLSSAYAALYSAFYVALLLRYNRRNLLTVKVFLLVMGGHGVVHAALAVGAPFLTAPGTLLGGSRTFQVYLFEALILSVASGCLYIAMTAEYLQNNLRQQADFDPLTRTVNRRAFRALAERAVERRKRRPDAMALMMLDLDHFKSVNDTYGHVMGDEVLCQIAAAISRSVRDGDVVCRYGGEEFVVLCPGAARSDADGIAQRILEDVEGLCFPYANGAFALTVSIGLAAFPGDGCDLDALIAAADEALYRAKANGRNPIEWASSVLRAG